MRQIVRLAGKPFVAIRDSVKFSISQSEKQSFESFWLIVPVFEDHCSLGLVVVEAEVMMRRSVFVSLNPSF